eukprot:CAMPEP_0202740400 /NCGR_PEP_ID=MMETSP1388-20130828/3517_1 /ASSEMBLY_ACC=CAM_ASM_000864 /TAXON_ID=37098 /ORGANISM="Isochrysis sp, Strain CCMP1244" /LENGTH=231 /DNA_ID=CAMNT_0049407147 /DNA_START=70 /DNA_END=763 /DNA_ORIENTATION=+
MASRDAPLGAGGQPHAHAHSTRNVVVPPASNLAQVLVAYHPRSLVHRQLHRRDLRVDLLHKLDHKVNKLVLPEGLDVEVCQQKGDVVPGDRLAPQDDEVVGAQHQEARELARQDLVHLIELLDLDGEADGVDCRLDEDRLMVGSPDHDRVQQQLARRADLHLGLVVPLDDLRRKVAHAERGAQRLSEQSKYGLRAKLPSRGIVPDEPPRRKPDDMPDAAAQMAGQRGQLRR